MKSLASGLDRTLLPLVIAAAALGLTWPAPARDAVNGHGITIALVVLVAAVGLGLPATAIRDARHHACQVTLAVIVPIGALPAIAWAASRIVAPGPLRLGVLAAGVAPSEIAAVALSAIAGGSVALSAAILVGSTAASVLLAGPILHRLAGTSSNFSSTALLVSLVLIVAVPLTTAAVLRARLPAALRDGADVTSSVLASTAVLVLIWLVAGQAHLDAGYLRATLALLVFLVASTALAAILTVGMDNSARISLLLPVAMRDFAIAAGIASHAFGSPAAADLGIYGVLLLGTGTARLLSPSRE